jgi:hypothetical protein
MLSTGRTQIGRRWWYLLLLIPFAALLWVPLYNRLHPTLFGIPFFYWYQFAWVFLTSLVIYIVDVCVYSRHENGAAVEAEREL